MPLSAQHSKKEIRWGTPSDIVERARTVMGGIDLDPCSSVSFNEIVKAERYYSLDDRGENGLELPWFGNVFVNPPGNLVRDFWRNAITAGWNQLIWVGFSVEQLAVLADERRHPMDFSFCILRKRISFTRCDGYKGSPSHSNYIAGLKVDHDKFAEAFGDIGRVYAPGQR